MRFEQLKSKILSSFDGNEPLEFTIGESFQCKMFQCKMFIEDFESDENSLTATIEATVKTPSGNRTYNYDFHLYGDDEFLTLDVRLKSIVRFPKFFNDLVEIICRQQFAWCTAFDFAFDTEYPNKFITIVFETFFEKVLPEVHEKIDKLLGTVLHIDSPDAKGFDGFNDASCVMKGNRNEKEDLLRDYMKTHTGPLKNL